MPLSSERLPFLNGDQRQPCSVLGICLCVAGIAVTFLSYVNAHNVSLSVQPLPVRLANLKGHVAAGLVTVGLASSAPAAVALDAPSYPAPPSVERSSGSVAFAGLDAPALDDFPFPESDQWSYTAFKKALRAGKIARVQISRQSGKLILETSSGRIATTTLVRDENLYKELESKGVEVTVVAMDPPTLLSLLNVFAGPILTIIGLVVLVRSGSNNVGTGQGLFNIGQSKARFEMQPKTGIQFADVAGVDEAKQDLVEVVEFLKSPGRFTAVGAKIPKGVLLVGPPGTGKTLLAKAVAGEAGVPFFNISGSEFVEVFVGVGASRVRDLFKKAKENSPCLIFIDEIDAVGRSRGAGMGQGNDEREQTLNQMLTEMDGFEGNTGVIVLAATNRAEILDSALLRPGRFDRQVSVAVPDLKGRKDILKVHAKNKKFDSDISLDVIALRTPGFSGADLANLLNEAAILAGRRSKKSISNGEVDYAIDRIVAGMEGTPLTDSTTKNLVAYHEVGHALCATLTEGHDPVQKVSLIPRGQAKGLTWFIPNDDPSLLSRQQLKARIVAGLGGRAAEEIIYGRAEVTTGAGGDLQQVTSLAKQMVTNFGFSDIGPWNLVSPGVMSQDIVMRMMAQNEVSEELQENIDRNVKSLIDEAYEAAKSHIINNREAMDAIVERLVEVEIMDGDEFRAMLAKYATIPAKNLAMVQQMKDGISQAIRTAPAPAAAAASLAIDMDDLQSRR
eukprot:EG_transcript_3641